MTHRFSQFVVALAALSWLSTVAFADVIGVGLLSYDTVSSTADEFDITNLTGLDAFPTSFPITTALTITITSLTVDLASGGPVVLPGSDFTVNPSDGDIDCDASATAACNFSGNDITRAILAGTFSPTTGLSGLPAGDTGIEAAFTTTLTPGCGTTYLNPGCDFTTIYATGVSGTTTVPEPSSWMLCLTAIGVALIRLQLRGRNYRKSA
jgi:hypothetical protein